MFPVPHGVHLPTGTWNLTDENPDVTAACAAIDTWRLAQLYAHTNNDGHSVTMGGKLFDPAGFAADQVTVPLQPFAATKVDTIPYNNALQLETVYSTIKHAANAAWLRISETLPPPQSPQNHPLWPRTVSHRNT